MTPEKKAEIEQAALRAHEAQLAFAWSGLRNVPHDSEKARELSVQHALAHAKLIEARAALNDAMRGDCSIDYSEPYLRSPLNH